MSAGAAAGDGVIASAPAGHRPWRAVALLVAGAFFMENLDGSIISTAAPRMARSFGVRPVAINVAIVAYLLTLAVFIPVSGWVSERLGTRTVFGAAVAMFTVASGLCALCNGLNELTVMRVLQGVGGALMVPVGRLAVLREVGREDLIDAIAYLTWPGLLAPVIAPALGGVLVTYASWRWIFVINIPLGCVAFLITLRIVPEVRPPDRLRFDLFGFLLTGVGLTTLVYGLELLTISGSHWVAFGVAIFVGLFTSSAAVRHLRSTRFPLLNLNAMRIPTFRLTTVGGSFFRLTSGAVPFLLPLMFQVGFGWSPLKSGLLVVAVFAGNIGVKPTTRPLLRRFGFKQVLIGSNVGACLAVVGCGFVGRGTPLPILIALLFGSGAFRSIGSTAYNTIAFADVAQPDLGSANTLAATIQQLTMGLGVVAGAVALRIGSVVVRAPYGIGTAPHAFSAAFMVIAFLPLLAAVESTLMRADAGSTVIAPTATRRFS